MKKFVKALALSCAVVPLAQAALFLGNPAFAAEAAAPVAAAPVTEAKPALWAVKDADTTIYLFGTIHVLKPGLGWFDEAVKDAFDKSDELVLELVLPENPAEVAQKMMPLAIDQTGTPLSSLLSDEERAAYAAMLAKFGVAPQQFDMFKPWFVGVTLTTMPLPQLGYNPEEGVEKKLTAFAKSAGKPVSGLETVEEQLGYFDNLPQADQLSFLNGVVRDLDKMGPMLDTLVTQWSAGDPEGLAETMNESMKESPKLTEILLWNRNHRWAEQIEEKLEQPGTFFVAVGAGHLAGEKSVQDYLAERGLTAERIDY
ncbi:TraB/GumN family protein [Sphingopyxis sp. MWB1]|uniref:TraB/GumN family protein n=1 Tax=Sphingopyxis sp. MWB1 TaxID=1537715 RepID=UPI000AD2E010|nr:TraB/GumN family protein [Sphingopyxis sp. MWB1]